MNTENVDIDNILLYCRSLAEEFHSRLNRVRAFVDNNVMSGTANEAILRDFLAELAARQFEVAQGFICNPTKSRSSRQCDLIMFDRNTYPLVYSQGEIRIVWPESVLMVIEIKTKIDSICRLKGALENIKSAKELEDISISRFSGIIFAFQSLTTDTIKQHLESSYNDLLRRPLAVLLFDRNIVIHQSEANVSIVNTRFGGGDAPYEIRISRDQDDKGTFVLTYLFLLFLQIQAERTNAFNMNDLYTAMRRLIDEQSQVL